MANLWNLTFLYKSAERTVLLICIISSVGTDCVQIVCHTMLATLYVYVSTLQDREYIGKQGRSRRTLETSFDR